MYSRAFTELNAQAGIKLIGQCDHAVDYLSQFRLEITLIKALGKRKCYKEHENKIDHSNRVVFVAMIQRPMLAERIEYIVLDLPS